MERFLGDKSRLALYFANMGIVPEKILHEWEEITLKGKNEIRDKNQKSPNIEEEFVISADELPLVKA